MSALHRAQGGRAGSGCDAQEDGPFSLYDNQIACNYVLDGETQTVNDPHILHSLPFPRTPPAAPPL